MNPTIELVDDSEALIELVNAMVNPTINIVDVNFDEDLLTNDEWLQIMQQKHHIDMMFGEIIPLEAENQMEDNMSATTQVSTPVIEIKTETMLEAKPNKEAHKEKIEIEKEVEKEVQQEKALITEQKEHNQCGSADVF